MVTTREVVAQEGSELHGSLTDADDGLGRELPGRIQVRVAVASNDEGVELFFIFPHDLQHARPRFHVVFVGLQELWRTGGCYCLDLEAIAGEGQCGVLNGLRHSRITVGVDDQDAHGDFNPPRKV